MKRLGNLLLAPARWAWAERQAVVATAAFCAICYGCWLAWAPLGWLVPGAIVFGSLVWTHLRGREKEK